MTTPTDRDREKAAALLPLPNNRSAMHKIIATALAEAREEAEARMRGRIQEVYDNQDKLEEIILARNARITALEQERDRLQAELDTLRDDLKHEAWERDEVTP